MDARALRKFPWFLAVFSFSRYFHGTMFVHICRRHKCSCPLVSRQVVCQEQRGWNYLADLAEPRLVSSRGSAIQYMIAVSLLLRDGM